MKPHSLAIVVLLATSALAPSLASAQQQPVPQQADAASSEPSASDRMKDMGGALLLSLFDRMTKRKKAASPAVPVETTQPADASAATGDTAPSPGAGVLMTEEPVAESGTPPQPEGGDAAGTAAPPRPALKPLKRPLVLRPRQ